eukprot:s573_g28.t1
MGGLDQVDGVLSRAAARAARLAELETAQTTIQKLLNIDMPPEMLPWGDVMLKDMTDLDTSKPAKLPRGKGNAAVASPTESTRSDADAIANVQKGLAAAAVASPVTPENQIRRTFTPRGVVTGPMGDQSILDNNTGSVEEQPAAKAAPVKPTASKTTPTSTKSSKGKGNRKKSSIKKKQKRGSKRQTKTKGKVENTTKKATTPEAAPKVPSEPAPSPAPVATQDGSQQNAAPSSEVPAATPHAATPGTNSVPHGKAAAKKCAAKKPTTLKTENQEPELPPCKLEARERERPKLKQPPTPPTVRENKARGAAMASVVQRANTAEQMGEGSEAPCGPTAPDEGEYYGAGTEEEEEEGSDQEEQTPP